MSCSVYLPRWWRERLGVILLALSIISAGSAQIPTGETPEQNQARLRWWKEAKFGLFIHWGVYAVPAGVYKGQVGFGASEWILNHEHQPIKEYRQYALEFNPTHYQPQQWVKMAKAAGMKYIVITSKHHDGFALFETKASQWNVVQATPYRKDLLRPLVEACRQEGIRLGFYYSQAQDWINGGSASGGKWDKEQDRDMDDYIDHVVIPQVRELLTQYGKDTPAILWWDTPIEMTPSRASRIDKVVKELRPDLITNSRLGGGYLGDSDNSEQFIPASTPTGRPWETCMTTNGSWGYKKGDEKWKSPQVLIQQLCETVAKGGNYLLNIGPRADGSIPQPVVDNFAQVGTWMKINGSAIYGTKAGPFPYRLPWGFASRSGLRLNLFIFDWPQGGRLVVPLQNRGVKASLLTAPDKAMPVEYQSGQFQVQLPPQPQDSLVTVVTVDCAEEPILGSLPPPPQSPLVPQPADGAITLTGGDSEVVGAHLSNGEGHLGYWSALDSYPRWRFDLKQAGKYQVEISYSVSPTQAGSQVELISGGQKLPMTVVATKNWGDYQTMVIGQITLTKLGEQTLTIEPRKMAGEGVMNLRSVVLRPVK